LDPHSLAYDARPGTVGASLLAMDFRTPRIPGKHALSLTTIASKLGPTVLASSPAFRPVRSPDAAQTQNRRARYPAAGPGDRRHLRPGHLPEPPTGRSTGATDRRQHPGQQARRTEKLRRNGAEPDRAAVRR